MKQKPLSSKLEATSPTPFFKSLHDEIERVFDRFGSNLPMTARDLWGQSDESVMPALDISETDKEIIVTAEVPGVDEKDMDVSITDGVLTLKGEKSSDQETKEENYHLVERRYGSFRRSVPLGFTPEENEVTANFKDGILKLRIQKPEDAKARTRKIKIGEN